MSELSNSATQHLEQLSALQVSLNRSGAAILEHRFLLLLMGSFELVIGTTHRRLKFSWDGREFFLNVQQCACPSQSSPQEWQPLANVRIAPPASVWATILEHSTREFGA